MDSEVEEKICALIRPPHCGGKGDLEETMRLQVTDSKCLNESMSHYVIHPCEHIQINVSCLAPEPDPLN